ncbi:MAG: diaminopimelate epimerase [Lentisphaeria bacterium]|nr:diaminopimelate epimerase [Lentisphaeria bacterium]
MKLHFDKLHGCGNDFIVAEDFAGKWPVSPEFIANVCNRHRGVGGDGMILIRREENGMLHMKYYNSDGSHGAMCGNGLRCATYFIYLHRLADGKKSVRLLGDDGYHDTEIMNDAGTLVRITLDISEAFQPVKLESGETVYKGIVGVPHVVVCRPDVEKVNVYEEGKYLRYHQLFQPAGANADFVSFAPDRKGPVMIRTYERGVENETLACGTGCASAGIVLNQFFSFDEKISLVCRGKDRIEIEIRKDGGLSKGVYLTGPAELAFSGELDVETPFQS